MRTRPRRRQPASTRGHRWMAAMPTIGLAERTTAHRTRERGVTEGEHAPVGGNQPVPAAVRRGSHSHNWCVEVDPPSGSLEGSVPVGEDAAVRSHHPVPESVRCGGGPHDGSDQSVKSRPRHSGGRAERSHCVWAGCARFHVPGHGNGRCRQHDAHRGRAAADYQDERDGQRHPRTSSRRGEKCLHVRNLQTGHRR